MNSQLAIYALESVSDKKIAAPNAAAYAEQARIKAGTISWLSQIVDNYIVSEKKQMEERQEKVNKKEAANQKRTAKKAAKKKENSEGKELH